MNYQDIVESLVKYREQYSPKLDLIDENKTLKIRLNNKVQGVNLNKPTLIRQTITGWR